MSGKESFPELETHFYLDKLVEELHYSMFNSLLDNTDRIVTWPAMDSTAYYYAVNLQPFDDYDRDPRPINAFQAVSRDWEVVRATDNEATNTRDTKSYITALTPHGLELYVIEHKGMPLDPEAIQERNEWLAAANESRERRFKVGNAGADERDYAEFENALFDLRAFNAVHLPNRSAFITADLLDRRMTGRE